MVAHVKAGSGGREARSGSATSSLSPSGANLANDGGGGAAVTWMGSLGLSKIFFVF